MQRYTVYLCLETALHVSGVTSTHHQEHIQLYLQHLVFVTAPLLLSAAIVKELEPTGLSVRWVAYVYMYFTSTIITIFFINVHMVLFLFNNVIYVFLLYDSMFMYD
jgi:hypothetical protein